MRNFRKAALAGATAVALAFGSTTIAAAEETAAPETNNQTPADAQKPSASTKIGASLGAYDENGNATAADGREIFGSEKEHFGEQPGWAIAFYATTIFAAVSALVGLVVGPAYNFVVHGLPNM
ncbi:MULTISPECIES: hypothetical protein [Corynebacterium]|uniref:hypothetical protein n=1 Tax=Corynebacterium TaxID=1716 RepID=UPI001195FFA9|nr:MULTISPECIES: hypothetical protein [Corynebacterium]TVX80934.1 hypothetical protein FPP74_03550 [Corynebacterium sp. NML180780]WJZ13384.1 hypothetical protein CGOTT_07305 [Corynebacterium gottingense]